MPLPPMLVDQGSERILCLRRLVTARTLPTIACNEAIAARADAWMAGSRGDLVT